MEVEKNKIKKDFWYRFYEILPGASIVTIFLSLILFSIFAPVFVIYFIIIYDILWVFRVIYMEINLIISLYKFKKVISINWFEKNNLEHKEKLDNVYHLVLFPTYKEPIEVIRESFNKLISVSYDKKKFIVVLAGEGAEGDPFIEKAKIIEQEFSSYFLKFYYTLHELKEGEVQGKGSNCASSGKKIKEEIDKDFSYIKYEDIIVSNLDIDTIIHDQYFAYITYLHLTIENPTRVSYQPLALFNNNFFDAYSTNRLVSRGTTFWLLSDFVNNDRLFTFSSHSMNFKALVDVGFWASDVVSEDSRIGLQCVNYYDGDYRVIPVYIPVSLDIVDEHNFIKSFINQYKQQRRWAYGMENFPYLMTTWTKNKKMPFSVKFKYIFSQIEGGVTWATAPIIMFIFGFLPLWVVNSTNESQSIIVRNAPFILENLMRVGMIGMIVNPFISFFFRPKNNLKIKFHMYIILFFEWFLLPFITILLGSIPANEAYIRLMLGKYLGFWVTPKSRK